MMRVSFTQDGHDDFSVDIMYMIILYSNENRDPTKTTAIYYYVLYNTDISTHVDVFISEPG